MKLSKPKSIKNLKRVTNQDDAVFEFLKSKSKDLSSKNIHWMLIISALLLACNMIYATGQDDPMFYVANSGGIIMLMIILVALNSVPNIFFTLWSREIFSIGNYPHKLKADTEEESHQSILANQFIHFIQDLIRYSNHCFQYWLGFIFALIAFSRFPYQLVSYLLDYYGSLDLVLRYLESIPFINILKALWIWPETYIEVFVGFIGGIAAWKIIAVSLWIWRLSYYFRVDPILGHPDKSGGLSPIGDFCLLNALIVAIPMSHLSGWLLVLSEFEQYQFWQYFLLFLLIPSILASTLMFFVPLWSTHQVMLQKRAAIQKKLDEISISMAEISNSLLNGADTITPDVAEKMLEKRKFLLQVYEQSAAVPVWPFNLSAVIKFLTSQMLPVIAITKSIIEIVA